MVTIYCREYTTLLMYLFPLMEKHRFNYSEVSHSNSTIHYYTSDKMDIRFIFDSEARLNTSVMDSSFIIIDEIHNVWGSSDDIDNQRNRWRELNYLTSENGCKVIILDCSGDDLDLKSHCTKSEFLQHIHNTNNISLISTRKFTNDKIKGVISNQLYLTLIYYYHYLKDYLFAFPDFNFGDINIEPEYDFISHLGLNSTIIDNKNWRTSFLESINFGNKSLFSPNTFIDRPIQNSILKIKGYNQGMFNWYNLLESRKAKIKIVFETSNWIDSKWTTNATTITEKTFKCFIDEHPYLLFIKKSWKDNLKNMGFVFACPENPNEYKSFIDKLCEGDNLDHWIEHHRNIFKHNRNKMIELVYSNNTTHIKELNKIIDG